MALQRVLSPKLCRNFIRILTHSRKHFKSTPSPKRGSTVDFDDSFDNFTSELIQRKVDVWETRKNSCKNIKNIPSEKYNNLNVSTLCNTEIDELFNNVLYECEDFSAIKLINECLKCEKCPKDEILMQVLYICAQKGEIKLIQDLRNLKINFESKFDFSIYEAHAYWVKGNVITALRIFEELYLNNPFLRRNVKVLMKKLIFDGVRDSSEAVLINLVKFSEKLVEKHKDYYIMLIVWEYCFLSKWFSDQQIALDLLSKHRRLCDKLESKLPFILSLTLKNHRTEPVHRLLEIFLSFQMREYYAIVAVALLNYQSFQGNLRSYREIIKWCQNEDIKLPHMYNEKYLQLLLNYQTETTETKLAPKKDSFKYQF